MIPDGTEVVIMSDKSCNDGGCGYTRPNGVAYRELRMRRRPIAMAYFTHRRIWRGSQDFPPRVLHALYRETGIQW